MIDSAPRFTIITSTFNCAAALGRTAASIREQCYRNVQWIVADGASTDSTIEVVRNNLDIVSHWFSAPDKGIYDAWNKACKFIDGDWVIFLGAGDFLDGPDVLKDVADFIFLQDEDVVVVYGNVFLQKLDGSPRYIDRKPRLDFWEFGRPALPHHQGVFQARSLFQKFEPFDATYKVAADSKFLLGAARCGRFTHFDALISRMSDDGASNNFENIVLVRNEVCRLCEELSLSAPFFHAISVKIDTFARVILHRVLPRKVALMVQHVVDRRRVGSGIDPLTPKI